MSSHLKKHTTMKGKKRTMTDEQLAYVIEHYPSTRNDELLTAIGWPKSAIRSLYRVAQRHGLYKDESFMRNCQAMGARAASVPNRGHHYERSIAALIAFGAEHRFKPGTSCRERLGEERDKARIQKVLASRNETIRRDRLRINWGLDQISNLKLVKEPRSRTHVRYKLKKLGYVVTRGARTIYYNDTTRRSPLIEQHAQQQGLTITPQ